MFNIGPSELLVILVLALVVVGPQRLPELSRQIGRGLREFRKMQDEVKDMVKLDLSEDTPTPRRGGSSAPRPHRSIRPASGEPVGSEADRTTSDPGEAFADAPPASPTPTDVPATSAAPTDVPATSPTPDVPLASPTLDADAQVEPPATSSG
jgi:sec-independent protein translocase protein TatB